MFDVFIIDSNRHCFQNSVKLFNLFKKSFNSVYLLSALDFNDHKNNFISIGDYNFVNGFNQALRVVKNKFSVFVNSSLEINELDLIITKLNYLKENLFDCCGSFGFKTKNFHLRDDQKKEVYQNLYQASHHALDIFVLEKSIFKTIGLLPCIPSNGEGLEYLIPWINFKNNKITFLDETSVFKNKFKIKKFKIEYVLDKQKCFFSTVANVYGLKKDFEDFYNQNFNYI